MKHDPTTHFFKLLSLISLFNSKLVIEYYEHLLFHNLNKQHNILHLFIINSHYTINYYKSLQFSTTIRLLIRSKPNHDVRNA